MKRSLLPLVVLAAVVWMPVGAASQAHPDFSGRWTVESDAPPAPATPGTPAPPARGDMGSGWGSPITITQDAAQLTRGIHHLSRVTTCSRR